MSWGRHCYAIVLADEQLSDEVSAIVLDPGYSSVRAGFAGEDTPKSFVNAHYGRSVGADGGETLVFGDDAIHNPRANLEIRNPMSKEGIVEDWDVATRLWEYSITSRLTSFRQADPRKNGLNTAGTERDGRAYEAVSEEEAKFSATEQDERPMEEHPLLMSEPAWTSARSREKCIEIAMENWGCPAFWLARNTVLAAYGAGKATALVVDVGAASASIAAVHDGAILKKSVQRSPLAGNWLSSQVRALFDTMEPKVELIPHYMIAGKTQVDAGAPAQATFRTYKPAPSESFKTLQEDRVLHEFKESVVEIWKGPGRLHQISPGGVSNLDNARTFPARPFEMPDGSNAPWGVERFQVAEGLYDEKHAYPLKSEDSPTKPQTIPAMIAAALQSVDIDLRPHLMGNIVVTGGTTLINGFIDRLNWELVTMYPGMKIKIQAAGLTSERRFGSWMGGSILGSLGTFHQMWISKKEYEEFGAGIVEKRCK